MGWVPDPDHAAHEGYFVAVVPIVGSGYRFRELDDAAGDGERPIRFVQAGCDCGWRSARLIAPSGTTWVPSMVMVPQSSPPSLMYPRGVDHPIEAAGIALWEGHTRELDAAERAHPSIIFAPTSHDDHWCSRCGGVVVLLDEESARECAAKGQRRRRRVLGNVSKLAEVVQAGDRLCRDCGEVFPRRGPK